MFARKTTLLTTVIVASAALTSVAAADSGNWRQKAIDAEQAREAAALEQGRYKGELTRREYRSLKAEQDRIAALERNAKADGYVSTREFREIRSAQVDASRHIAAETTDHQKSFWRRWMYLTR